MKEERMVRGLLGKAVAALGKYKYVLLIAVVGVVLLTLPDFGGGGAVLPGAAAATEEDFSVALLEEKLARALSEIEGAGQVTVVLTAKGGAQRVLAQDATVSQRAQETEQSRKTVVVAGGTGVQETVLLQQLYPQFQGALVVCSGGGDPTVRLKLMEAVSALTGLGADKISICKGK